MNEEPLVPEGVTLRDPMDFASLRTRIYDQAVDAMKTSFPQTYGGVRMELDNLEYVDPEEYSIAEEKAALSQDRFLGRRLRGTIKLYDAKTNDILDEKTTTLMRVPYLSRRGTFIHGGSDYANLTQARLLPGVYTRKKKNGQVETQFNVRPGSGNAFRVNLDPSTGQYRLNVGGSTLHLYSLLRDLGVTDEELKNRWGEDIWALNSSKYDKKTTEKAYGKLVPRFMKAKEGTTEMDRASAIKAALERSAIHEYVARKNLPNMFDLRKAAEWKVIETVNEAIEEGIEFAPTLTPDEALDSLYEDCPWMEEAEEEFQKHAADQMEGALSPEELREEYNVLYGRTGPRLASMKKWPSRWFPAGSNELGWLAWYFDYANGTRTADDERQIKRWKSFRRRHGEPFKSNPTARRAYALRNWAIDPMSLLDDDAARTKLQSEMDEYKEKKVMKYELDKAAASEDPGELESLASLASLFLGIEFSDLSNKETTLQEFNAYLA